MSEEVLGLGDGREIGDKGRLRKRWRKNGRNEENMVKNTLLFVKTTLLPLFYHFSFNYTNKKPIIYEQFTESPKKSMNILPFNFM